MVEQTGERQKLIEDYEVVFAELPQLKSLALSYWDQVGRLSGSDGAAQEEIIFNSIVVEMSQIILDDDSFQDAMELTGSDAVESAIIESVFMIEVVLDMQEIST